jgi:hypothetical protein
MLAIGDPMPGSGGVFARGNDRRMADQGDQFPLPLHLQAQHAEAILRVVEGNPFHQPGEAIEFACRGVRHDALPSGEVRAAIRPATCRSELALATRQACRQPALFEFDVARRQGKVPWIEAELAGIRRAQGVEEFSDFRRAQGSILSFRRYRHDCSDSHLAGKSIRHSGGAAAGRETPRCT